MLRKQGLAGNFIFPICACPAVCFALSHFCTLPPNHLDRLDVLRKGPGLPRLTVASEVPTIIADYCCSWLNGKRPAKRRQAKIWLIMVHSFDNFIRSELPAWKSDMAGKAIGKPRKVWEKWRTILHYNSTNAPISASNRNLEPIVSEFIRDCLSRLQSESPTFFRFLGVLLTYLNKVTFQQVITTCTHV